MWKYVGVLATLAGIAGFFIPSLRELLLQGVSINVGSVCLFVALWVLVLVRLQEIGHLAVRSRQSRSVLKSSTATQAVPPSLKSEDVVLEGILYTLQFPSNGPRIAEVIDAIGPKCSKHPVPMERRGAAHSFAEQTWHCPACDRVIACSLEKKYRALAKTTIIAGS